MLRYAPFILIALVIDGLQALLSWAFIAMGSALGAAAGTAATGTGALAGCGTGAAAGAVGGAVVGGVGAIPGAVGGCAAGAAAGAAIGSAAGTAAGSTFASLGVALGFASDICMSATLGVALIVLLSMFGMFYPKYILGGGVGEMIPGLDVLPGWTLMTVLCILRKAREENSLKGTAAFALTAVLSPKTAVGSAYARVKSTNQSRVDMLIQKRYANQETAEETRGTAEHRVASELKEIDGIRAPLKPTLRKDVPLGPEPTYAT